LLNLEIDFPTPTLARKALGSNTSFATFTKAGLSFAGTSTCCYITPNLAGCSPVGRRVVPQIGN
jgi:hypothetical protein